MLFQNMATDQADVFAAGDIVEFPLFTVGGKNVNIQHWQMAHAHGMFYISSLTSFVARF